jgi:GNAT superfamily N-acetyltransferase
VTPDELAGLCAAAMPEERLTRDELAYLCFGEDDACIGDARGAATFRLQDLSGQRVAWLTLVVVAPEAQRRGIGKQLVGTVADQAASRGSKVLMLANAIPRYVWPGVDVANTRAGMLVESLGFEFDSVAINMDIDTAFRAETPTGTVVERETGDAACAFAARAYPHFVPELAAAVAKGTAFVARDAAGETIAFGCHSVNRIGWIGPLGTDPATQHRGVGTAIMSALCADLEARGIATGEIAWVSNLRFYGKCGARVSRVFQGGRLRL